MIATVYLPLYIPARSPTENKQVSIFGATAEMRYPDDNSKPEMQTAVLQPNLSPTELDKGPETCT